VRKFFFISSTWDLKGSGTFWTSGASLVTGGGICGADLGATRTADGVFATGGKLAVVGGLGGAAM
jgi:hypothetical protein